MKVLVIEKNLMWSMKLKQSLAGLGHEAKVVLAFDPVDVVYDVAIVNLAEVPKEVVSALNSAGVFTIGHAGHKESELLQYGADAGCSIIATNSQLTFKLAQLLESALDKKAGLA